MSHHSARMAADLPVKLKLLTLNCWAIPFLSKLRKERIRHIGEEISTRDYDVVCLQEVWSSKDFKSLKDMLSDCLPYAYQFHSGVVGSAICVFSKSPITEMFYHKYSANGLPHFWHPGEWLTGSMVGLCRIIHHGIKINIYVTHLHEETNAIKKYYYAHRLIQAYELSQFIKFTTSESSDVNVLMGDFNTEQHEGGYELICKLIEMNDSWITQQSKANEHSAGITCVSPSNPFTIPDELKMWPNGARIDYIFYNSSQRYDVKCIETNVTMTKVPGKDYSYSDHEGVATTLEIMPTENQEKQRTSNSQNEQNKVREHVLRHIRSELVELKTRRLNWIFRIFLILGVVFAFLLLDIPGANIVMSIAIVPTSFLLWYCIFMATLWWKSEEKSLRENLNLVELELMNN
ncbi:sphingomyelin phosphodiesterase 2-like [Saccoglossus kowalevskii]